MNTIQDDANMDEIIKLIRECNIPSDKLLAGVKFLIDCGGTFSYGTNQGDYESIRTSHQYKEPTVFERMIKDNVTTKLQRIIWIRNNWGYGLMDAKKWVEDHFANNGCGSQL